MTTSADIAELKRRHKALEDEIAEAQLHSSTDDLMIISLKRRKLYIRDEIEHLVKECDGIDLSLNPFDPCYVRI